ncbi:hypothetical protein [Candidatus Enterococcus mangumiae]|uniref:Uncharacterized protein n=1 Tax=Candidatus Enterococcus mangumiae TaxID=2230878 RepID=A0ABZ2SVJ8_9ENTE|nr:hypothetical protein [Enterococcus sp. DIV1094]MBO0490229.1 hypothetical protein [Enterococcus sp. DIV1094]
MKKVKWIFSINADGVFPFGYAGIKTGQFVLGHVRAFQQELTSLLGPEIELEFISYNTRNSEAPSADLIVYTDVDEKYLDEETKKKGLSIPYKLYYLNEIEKIKESIEANV